MRFVLVFAFIALSQSGAMAAEPSFVCADVSKGSVAELICTDEELASLDRTLAASYAQAAEKASNEHPPVLKAEQRGWIKGRDDCWKSPDRKACVKEAYVRRIAELQARYRLVSADGPFAYTCDSNPANEIVVTFYSTQPATVIAERGDSTSFMVREPAETGSKYVGRNEVFWEKGGEATVTWGYDAPQMSCTRKP